MTFSLCAPWYVPSAPLFPPYLSMAPSLVFLPTPAFLLYLASLQIDNALFDRLFDSGRVNAVLQPEDLPGEGKQVRRGDTSWAFASKQARRGDTS